MVIGLYRRVAADGQSKKLAEATYVLFAFLQKQTCTRFCCCERVILGFHYP